MPSDFETYQQEIAEDVGTCLSSMECQPILFVGAGLTKRYFDSPTWVELLELLSDDCPLIDKPFAYYRQSYPDLIDIGEVFADRFKEWAWSDPSKFPDKLFEADQHPHIFLKHAVCERLKAITPSSVDAVEDDLLRQELNALQAINPHAIITTNYDAFLEVLFPQYESIVGEQVLHSNYSTIGEVLKIHGCVTDPSSLVLTRQDYEVFIKKRKYLSAKLLAFFAEHPLMFVGYKAGDPNIKYILSDIDLLLSANNELIPNIYILERQSNLAPSDYPPREKVISIDGARSVRIKSITADSSAFQWVYDIFGQHKALDKVNVKLLRTLLHRTYNIVRHDIPMKTSQVNYDTLEHVLDTENELATLLGIQTHATASLINADFPYTLTGVAQQLGHDYWHFANVVLQRIKKERGVDIKASDNQYHIGIKVGQASVNHKYSQLCVDLLRAVEAGEEYRVDL